MEDVDRIDKIRKQLSSILLELMEIHAFSSNKLNDMQLEYLDKIMVMIQEVLYKLSVLRASIGD